MKKSVVAAIGGLVLGIIIIISIFVLIQVKAEPAGKDSENLIVENPSHTTGTEEIFETEIFDTDVEFDTDTETESEVETETESEGGGLLAGIGSLIDGILSGNTSNTDKNNSENKKKEYPYYIKVNRQANCVTIYGKDEDGKYTVPVKAMTCSVGLNGNTPLGVSKISDKYKWRLLFGDVYGQYSVRFNGHILFHSVPYLETEKDTLLEGQFNMLGQPASKGCIRLACIDAKWIYDNCPVGTTVEVYDSPDPGPLGKPEMPKISLDSPYSGWDPTDPDKANPWKKGEVKLSGVKKSITINQGETVDLLNGVTATDIDGLPLEVKVKETIDTNVPGKYTITYVATSVLGTEKTATATLTIKAVAPPATEKPETQKPETEKPETQKPETEQPETQKPETQKPETEQPETQKPETEQPETQQPETQKPETEQPETQQPETQKPETEKPETEQPETQQPETEQSEIQESEASELQEPGTEQPIMEEDTAI